MASLSMLSEGPVPCPCRELVMLHSHSRFQSFDVVLVIIMFIHSKRLVMHVGAELFLYTRYEHDCNWRKITHFLRFFVHFFLFIPGGTFLQVPTKEIRYTSLIVIHVVLYTGPRHRATHWQEFEDPSPCSVLLNNAQSFC